MLGRDGPTDGNLRRGGGLERAVPRGARSRGGDGTPITPAERAGCQHRRCLPSPASPPQRQRPAGEGDASRRIPRAPARSQGDADGPADAVGSRCRACSPARRTPAANHPGTAHLLAGFYWEQRSSMQGLHCPRAGSPRPGTGRLWSMAAEASAFATVCAGAGGRSPAVPTPACGSSSPARGQSCSVAPREVTGAGVSAGGSSTPQHPL